MFKFFACILISYLLGNISGGMIFGKILFHKDIREYGSKNAGTTNALRVFGIKTGALTFVVDFLKAILACLIGYKLIGENGIYVSALFVVLGHNWPIFLNFRGGKGIASSFGFIFFFDYKIALILFVFFIIVVLICRYISVASMLSTIIAILIAYLFNYKQITLYITLFVLCLLSIYRHKSNILRLINGTENKISFGKGKKA